MVPMRKWSRPSRHSDTLVHREPERFLAPPGADERPCGEGSFDDGSFGDGWGDRVLRFVATVVFVGGMWWLSVYSIALTPMAIEYGLCSGSADGPLCSREGSQLAMVATICYIPALALVSTHRIATGSPRVRHRAAWIWVAGLLTQWVVTLTLANHSPADWMPGT
jgi:hypothetical protein